jgi:UDP-N-acetylglucosamine 4,6-dehydratase
MTTLVTGGTGSFGHAYVKRHHGHELIKVLSRDEEKQRAMAREFPDVVFILGDIRDPETVRRAMFGVDYVFHAAALKQVPQCESFPMEAVRTNVIGTDNVCQAARDAGARAVLLSTDKAVEPVGVMGGTKFLAEAVATQHGFNVVRYGNVIGSRGSIVPVWREMVAKGEPLTITDPKMTRFVITLGQALDLLELAMEAPPDGTIFVKRSPAGTVEQFARVLAPGHPVTITGPRPGEKRHEHLVVADESVIEYDDHFCIAREGVGSGIAYSSQTAFRLTDTELAALFGVPAPQMSWIDAFG